MTTDIQQIRVSLQGCEEVHLPYTFKPKTWIKYITVKGEDEAFYEGGEFLRYGHHKLILHNKGKQITVPTCIRSDEGEIMYRSRFFIDMNREQECEKDKLKLQSVVQSQARIIEQSAKQLRILEERCQELETDNHSTRIELGEVKHQLNEATIREKKYKLILSQYV